MLDAPVRSMGWMGVGKGRRKRMRGRTEEKEVEGEKLLFPRCLLQLCCLQSASSLCPSPRFFSSSPNPANVL